MSTDSGWLQRKSATRVARSEQQQLPAPETTAAAEEEANDTRVESPAFDTAPVAYADADDNDGRADRGGGEERGRDAAYADDGSADDDERHAPDIYMRRRRNRVSFMPSDASSSSGDEQHAGDDDRSETNDAGDDDNDNNGTALDRYLRDDDSDEDGNRSDRGGLSDDDHDEEDEEEDVDVNELGLEDGDLPWGALADRHPGLLMFQRFHPLHRRGHEIALHLANAREGNTPAANANGGGANVVDLQNTQEGGDTQEIDLTTLSSDSEDDVAMRVGRGRGGGDHHDDDDDEVEIVGTTVPLLPMPIVPGGGGAPGRGGLTRKRRRPNETASDEAAPHRPFDTQRAESTNVSMENNETIERFKSALKCSVCLEVIEDMTSTICGHVYCAKCIRLAIRVTHKCPLCQRPLRPTDVHGLYF